MAKSSGRVERFCVKGVEWTGADQIASGSGGGGGGGARGGDIGYVVQRVAMYKAAGVDVRRAMGGRMNDLMGGWALEAGGGRVGGRRAKGRRGWKATAGRW